MQKLGTRLYPHIVAVLVTYMDDGRKIQFLIDTIIVHATNPVVAAQTGLGLIRSMCPSEKGWENHTAVACVSNYDPHPGHFHMALFVQNDSCDIILCVKDVEANDQKTAEELSMQHLLDSYPISDGWYNHFVLANPTI